MNQAAGSNERSVNASLLLVTKLVAATKVEQGCLCNGESSRRSRVVFAYDTF